MITIEIPAWVAYALLFSICVSIVMDIILIRLGRRREKQDFEIRSKLFELVDLLDDSNYAPL